MTKTNIATQSKAMIYSKMNYSLNEQKILLILIAQIDTKSTEIKPITITLKDMSEFYGKKIVSRELKRTLDKLNSHFWLKIDNKHIQTSMFSEIIVEDGSSDITFIFSKRVEEHLINFKPGIRFVQTNIKNIVPLSNKYSVRIYQLLKLHLWDKEVRKELFNIELEELQTIFMTPKSYNNDFNLFNTKVLKPALEEINKKTDLNFSYETHKTGRKVTTITFDMSTDMLKSSRIKHNQNEKYNLNIKFNKTVYTNI